MDTKQTLIAQLEGMREELLDVRERLHHIPNGAGYIVQSADGLSLTYKHDGSKVHSPRVTRAHLAVRFTREGAEKIAALTRDNDGHYARPVHIRDAVAAEIRQIEESLNFLRACS
jgi:hypothetical protein